MPWFVFLTAWATEFIYSAEPIRIDTALVTLIDKADIPARDAGVLAELTVTEGQSVKKGDTLARLDLAEQHAAREEAVAAAAAAAELAENDIKLRYARAGLAVAQAEYQRAKESLEKFEKSVSQTELDQLRLVVEKSALEIEQAEQDLKLAKLTEIRKRQELAIATERLEKRRILAPFDGIVAEVRKQRGEWVQPGETVLRLIRSDRLRVEGFLPAAATLNLASAEVQFACPALKNNAQSFPGKITFVSPEVNAVNGQVRIWAELPNAAGQLRPGLVGELIIKPVTE
ncbi:MAG: efflux RND transporter periplasmic adaptor subunit [Pirellulales bacterium]|nr:efflux RND transporter periplasmic adaptor subunit [Pirellulales bacterium]